MNTPLWVSETASAFWANAGGYESFPRNLRIPIANSLPLAVVSLPALRLASVELWMQKQGVPCSVEVGDRRLRACLVARYGQGLIFLDGADPEDEQRFSLAHELAHFLRDYWAPRQVVSDRLGQGVLEVLDGDRPPRNEERMQALLARVQIGFHVHLMGRSSEGSIVNDTIEAAERDADRLAFELLAPSDTVLREAKHHPRGQHRELLVPLLIDSFGLPAPLANYYASLLIDSFGLPAPLANYYASLLSPKPRTESSLVRRLGLAP